jgi:formylglycine-generating enzyme required for sulfatase activity
MGGNVGEWVMDCWHDTYLRAPTDGTAWVNPGCERRVVRGGYWASSPAQARSAYRLSADPGRSDARIGFRIARDL